MPTIKLFLLILIKFVIAANNRSRPSSNSNQNQHLKRELRAFRNNDYDDDSIKAELRGDGTNILFWRAYIKGPSGTPYEDGVFQLSMDFPMEYPAKPPTIYFDTPVYHPNISTHGEICVDLLREKWSPNFNIRFLLLAICTLLAQPNPENPIRKDVANQLRRRPSQFNKEARRLTRLHATGH